MYAFFKTQIEADNCKYLCPKISLFINDLTLTKSLIH